jgi:hypothetical protein
LYIIALYKIPSMQTLKKLFTNIRACSYVESLHKCANHIR